MERGRQILFHPFRLDTGNERLWRGSQVVSLRPKSLAVLRYLAEHPGRLIARKELLNAVWLDTHVSTAALKVCIGEIRGALGDNPTTPQFIETRPRQGYRFIAPITPTQLVQSAKCKVQNAQSAFRFGLDLPLAMHSAFWPVGREEELGQLQRWLEKALAGERQVVFITGEPGIGKTTVGEAFLQSLESSVQSLASENHSVPPQDFQTLDPRRQTLDANLWIARGQCLEHYGVGEAYLPVLEALGQLCRELGGERLIEILDQYAPTWLAQMPALLNAADLEALQRRIQGTTRERMLREMAEAVEALTAEKPLVLVLEDLHWSDYATLDLVSFLARRRQPARLLLIGTYRPAAVLVDGHPLQAVKPELQMHKQCEEMPLGFLTEAAVAEYLTVRFPRNHFPAELARVIHRHTDGNPLFMVNVVDYVVAQELIVEVDGWGEVKVGVEAVEVGVPESLRRMVEQQIDGLSRAEQQVLEAASVAGAEFSAAAVAAGLEEEEVQVEERCEGLARRGQFLKSSGQSDWPDGTVAGRYGFIHPLYQNVLYDRVTVGRRLQLHRRIGERQEAGYQERTGGIAAELAVHFEQGRDYRRAVQYLWQAAENALRRCAYQEAINHLIKGLALLKTLPDTFARTQQELTLQVTLGAALITTKGYAAPEVEKTYARARELCQQIGETPQLFAVLWGLWVFYFVRGELETARELGEQLFSLAQGVQDPALLLEAHVALGSTLFCLGELTPALAHLEQGIALYDPQQYGSHAFLYGQDPGMVCLSWAAWTLWLLGYPDQALKRSHEALTLVQTLSHPPSLAYALGCAAVVHQLCGEGQVAQERAQAVIALSREQGFAFWVAMGTVLGGWALAEQEQREEGIAQMRQGLAAWRDTGAEMSRPYFLALLAAAYGKAGQALEGLSVLTEALAGVHKNMERFCEAELHRLKGELTLQQSKVQSPKSKVTNTQHPTPSTQAEAEACFVKAIDMARCQSAKSWELRAVMSLSRLWQRQGKKKKARKLLAEIYGWFTEGFATADLQEAKALLEELRKTGGPE